MSIQRTFGLVYPLWSHVARGDLLDRAVGEAGLGHITIPIITGPYAAFRPADALRPHVFVTRGGWHYRSSCTERLAGPLRLRTAAWLGKRNVLPRVLDTARSRGLRVVWRLDLPGAGGLVEHNPHLGARNAWGEQPAGAAACVLNPATRELLAAVAGELRDLVPEAAFEWSGARPDRALPASLAQSPRVSATAGRWLSVCFCPSCWDVAQAAGVDAEQAAAAVRRLAGAGEPVRDEDAATAEHYQQVRVAYWRNWWAGFTRRSAGEATWFRLCTPSERANRTASPPRPTPAGDTGPEPPALVDLLRVPADQTAPLDAGALPALADGVAALSLPLGQPPFSSSDALVRCVHHAAESGVRFFDFERLDESPVEVLTWVRQAVRYAQRG